MHRAISAVAGLCGAMAFALSATAANWIEFDRLEYPGRVEHFELDADSLAITAQPLSVTWRRYSTSQFSPTPETQEIAKARVYCADMSIATDQRETTLVRKDGSPGMRLGPPPEYASSVKSTAWATWDNPNGKLIRRVCQAAIPGWSPDFVAAQGRDCAGKAADTCSPDLTAATGLLIYRKKQVSEVCTAAADDAGKAAFLVLADNAIADVLAEASRCQDLACRKNAIDWMVFRLNADLEKAATGQSCEAIQQRIAKIERDKQATKGMDGMRAYLACAANKAPSLDDGISPAESVASGLHSACLSTFDAAANLLLLNADNRSALARELRPKLIETVLQYRAALKVPKGSGSNSRPSKRIQS